MDGFSQVLDQKSGGRTRPKSLNSRETGVDILLLSKSDREHAILEVKRWAPRIGVEIVRQVRGVQLREGAQRSIVVSALGFTAEAHAEAAAVRPIAAGYQMELTTIRELLTALGSLPPSLAHLLSDQADRTEFRYWFAKEYGVANKEGGIINPRFSSSHEEPWGF